MKYTIPSLGRIAVAAAVVCLFGGSYLAKTCLMPPIGGGLADTRHAERIVSTAPSVTETLFALGLGDRVVGVTNFCNFPPETADLPQIGGHSNTNYEAIVALQPDLVVLLEAAGQPVTPFDKLRLNTLVVDHQRIEGILDSMRQIGRAFGKQQVATETIQNIEQRLDRVARKTEGQKRPRVLFVISRADIDDLGSVSIAGTEGHLDRILQLAGGQNAYSGNIRFPKVSQEGLLHMNPQVIIELVGGWSNEGITPDRFRDDWRSMPEIDAVQNDRVFILDDDYALIPGPRFILLVEKLAQHIHTEIDWNE